MEILSNLLPPDIVSLEIWLKRSNHLYLLAIAATVALSFVQYFISSELDNKRKLQLLEMKQETATINSNTEQIKLKTLSISLELEKERIKRIETEEKLKSEIEKTNKKIKPPRLSLIFSDIDETAVRTILSVKFKPSKNQPLGAIKFTASLPEGSDSEIIDFWPNLDGGAFQTGDKTKQISDDKKTAKLAYSLISIGLPSFKLTLSKFAPVTVNGNYIEEPIIVDSNFIQYRLKS